MLVLATAKGIVLYLRGRATYFLITSSNFLKKRNHYETGEVFSNGTDVPDVDEHLGRRHAYSR